MGHADSSSVALEMAECRMVSYDYISIVDG